MTLMNGNMMTMVMKKRDTSFIKHSFKQDLFSPKKKVGNSITKSNNSWTKQTSQFLMQNLLLSLLRLTDNKSLVVLKNRKRIMG